MGGKESFIVAHDNQFWVVKLSRQTVKNSELSIRPIKDVQGVCVTPTGRMFVAQQTGQSLGICELFQDLERKIIGQVDGQYMRRYSMISNESGSIVWLIMEGRAIAFDVARSQKVKEIRSDALKLDSCVFAASKKDLIVARINYDPTKPGPGALAWNGQVLRSSGAALTPLFTVDGMLLLSMVVGHSGELILCAREDLHVPTTGLVRCLEADTYQTKWETKSELPLSACVCRDSLLLASGGQTVCAYNVKDGNLLARVKVGTSDTGSIACTSDAASIVTVSIGGTQVFELQNSSQLIQSN